MNCSYLKEIKNTKNIINFNYLLNNYLKTAIITPQEIYFIIKHLSKNILNINNKLNKNIIYIDEIYLKNHNYNINIKDNNNNNLYIIFIPYRQVIKINTELYSKILYILTCNQYNNWELISYISKSLYSYEAKYPLIKTGYKIE